MNRFVIVLGFAALLGLGWMACIGEPPQYTGVDDAGLDSGDGDEPDAVGDLDAGDTGGDGDGGETDTGDGDSDVSECDRETKEQFCDEHGAECGEITGDDRCGEEWTVNCDEVDGLGCEAPRSCSEENSCECSSFNSHNFEDLCDLVGAECGMVDASDVCDDWQGAFGCGDCSGDKECGSEIENVCGCPCEIGGECYASGATDGDDVCQICDPGQPDAFSNAPDGTDCGDNASCQGGECKCETDYEWCGGECVDTDTDPLNCGSCGFVCDTSANATPSCAAGDCYFECREDGEDYCPIQGVCADHQNDDAHCGECGNSCDGNESCIEGGCCEAETDEDACGDNECGSVENSCGERVECGECEHGKECGDESGNRGQCICPTGEECCESNEDCDGTLEICCGDGSCRSSCVISTCTSNDDCTVGLECCGNECVALGSC